MMQRDARVRWGFIALAAIAGFAVAPWVTHGVLAALAQQSSHRWRRTSTAHARVTDEPGQSLALAQVAPHRSVGTGDLYLAGWPHTARSAGIRGKSWAKTRSHRHRVTDGGFLPQAFGRDVDSDPQAALVGQRIWPRVLNGEVVVGQVVHIQPGWVTIRQLFPRYGATDRYRLTRATVSWDGGWRFVGANPAVGAGRVINLAVAQGRVTAMLPALVNVYGRVVWANPQWVVVRPIEASHHANPACAPLASTKLVLQVTAQTLWSSPSRHLPVNSLVQFVAFGSSGHPMLLGGIEDYGRAPCPAKVVSLYPSG